MHAGKPHLGLSRRGFWILGLFVPEHRRETRRPHRWRAHGRRSPHILLNFVSGNLNCQKHIDEIRGSHRQTDRIHRVPDADKWMTGCDDLESRDVDGEAVLGAPRDRRFLFVLPGRTCGTAWSDISAGTLLYVFVDALVELAVDPYRSTIQMPHVVINPASVRTVKAPRLNPNTKMRSPGCTRVRAPHTAASRSGSVPIRTHLTSGEAT